MKKNKGISLITLIITIIVIIILAGIIISALFKINIIEIAQEAKFKHNLSEYNSEYVIWSSNEKIYDPNGFNSEDVIAVDGYGNYKDNDIKKILPDIKNEDLGKVIIINGKVQEKDKPIYTDKQLDDMIKNQGYIPIANSEELNNIRNKTENIFGKSTKWEGTYTGGVDKKYVQVKDVIMTNYAADKGWQPIQQNNSDGTFTYFSGIYDGNARLILGMKINDDSEEKKGLFSTVSSDNAELKNIYIYGFDIKGNGYVGSLFGYSDNIKTIDNIHVIGNVSTINKEYHPQYEIGGIIGSISMDKTIDIIDCSANVNMDAQNNRSIDIAGIGGDITAGGGTLKNISATGNIKNSYYASCAGIAANYRSYNLPASMDSCNSNINIKGGIIGGLVENYYNNIKENNAIINITNCYCNGDFSGSGVGGLFEDFGTSLYDITNNNITININNCYYNGNIKDLGDGLEFGGIIYNTDIYNSDLIINNVYSKGKAISDSKMNQSGGILGDTDILSYGNIKLSNSYSNMCIAKNNGQNSNDIGGLIGSISADGNMIISDCNYTSSGINCKNGSYIGGIVGNYYNNNSDNQSKIVNTYVKTNIIGNNETGGIIGAAQSNIYINNCNFEGKMECYNSYACGGIVGYLYMASINNCKVLANIYNYGGSITSGGLVGENAGNGSIENSSFEGNIYINKADYCLLGGLVGFEENGGLISQCYAKCDINCDFKDSQCYGYVGGITGEINDSNTANIQDCYYIGKISSNSNKCYAGGIVPLTRKATKVTNCYNVTEFNNYNGLVGAISSPEEEVPTLQSCYWNKDISKISNDVSGVVGNSTSEMKTKGTYLNWDFDNVWNIDPNINDGYPYLKNLT